MRIANSTPNRYGMRQMRPRDPQESHRVASPLELFFDLVFVVAIAFSSAQLHHIEQEGHFSTALVSFLLVFFAVWWAWMNFTWFATAFDVDDWAYRVLTVVQMAGVLVFAAGTDAAMNEGDFSVATYGYVIMRLAMVCQWLRAMRSHPDYRATAARYVIGISTVQVLWLLRLLLPESLGLTTFLLLALMEIAIPVWAESQRATPWHPHHITERYSLFTIILLGESILASANTVTEALETGDHLFELLVISVSGLIIAAGMWWVYFSREKAQHITTLRSTLRFGYVHFVIFAAAGALSAGIEIAVDTVIHHAEVGRMAAVTLSLPVSLFILGIWWLSLRNSMTTDKSIALLIGAAIVLLSALVAPPWSMAIAAIGVVICAASTEIDRHSESGLDDGGYG